MRTMRWQRALVTALVASAFMAFGAGCGATGADQAQPEETAVEQESSQDAATAAVADGTYDIEVETDSSMFRSDSCTLTVQDGAYTATLVLPGEGFSRLYFGSAEDAASAADADIYDYHLNDEGKYTFDLPVTALDQELSIAAYGQRRDTWYDHTIVFHAPAPESAE